VTTLIVFSSLYCRGEEEGRERGEGPWAFSLGCACCVWRRGSLGPSWPCSYNQAKRKGEKKRKKGGRRTVIREATILSVTEHRRERGKKERSPLPAPAAFLAVLIA